MRVKDRLTTASFIQKYLKAPETPLLSKPKLVTFDAYNTLYATKRPVLTIYSEQYNKILSTECNKFIADETLAIMNKHFVGIFKAHMATHPNYGKYTGITPTQWWVVLIKSIFRDVDITLSDTQAEQILKPFEGDVYDTFPDVRSLLKTINGESHIGVCSNTDPMFHKIINHLKLKYKDDFVLPEKQYEFLSFYMEKKKDCTGEFFNLVQEKLEDINKNEIWHVGDELKNDLIGSVSSGWVGICIDRGDVYGYFSSDDRNKIVSNADITQEKINKSVDAIYEEGSKCDEVVLLENNGMIVRNLYTVEKIYKYLL